MRQVDDVHGEEGIESIRYRRPTKASEDLVMRLQGRGLDAEQPRRTAAKRQGSRYLPRSFTRSLTRSNPRSNSPDVYAVGAGAVPLAAVQPVSGGKSASDLTW